MKLNNSGKLSMQASNYKLMYMTIFIPILIFAYKK